MRKILLLALLIVPVFFKAEAVDLMQAYASAKSASNLLKEKYAQSKENDNKARSYLSVLFPQIALGAETSRGKFQSEVGQYNVIDDHVDVLAEQTLFNLSFFQAAFHLGDLKNLGKLKYQISVQDLTEKVVKAYFDLLYAHHLLKLAKLNQSVVKTALYQIKVAKEANLKTENQLSFVQSDYDDAVSKVIHSQAVYSDAIANLDDMVGFSADRIYSLKDNLLEKLPAIQPLSVWQTRMLRHNLDLLAMHESVSLAQAEVHVERDQSYPDIKAIGDYSFIHNHGSAVINGLPVLTSSAEKEHGYMVGVVLSMPIFSGGAIAYKVDALTDKLEALQFKRDQLVHDLMLKTRNDYLMLLSSREQVEAENQAVSANELALKLTRIQMKEHQKTRLHVLKALEKLNLSEQNYQKAAINYCQYYIALHGDAGDLSKNVILTVNKYLNLKHAIPISQFDRYPVGLGLPAPA